MAYTILYTVFMFAVVRGVLGDDQSPCDTVDCGVDANGDDIPCFLKFLPGQEEFEAKCIPRHNMKSEVRELQVDHARYKKVCPKMMRIGHVEENDRLDCGADFRNEFWLFYFGYNTIKPVLNGHSLKKPSGH